VALPFFLLGRALKLRCIYVESAARSSGPSLTGKMIAAIPGVSLYTQYAHWTRGRWQYQGSVFDTFEPRAQADGPTEIRRAVVTLGTLGYGFPKLVQRAMRVLPSDAEVLWQTGDTDTRDLSIDAVRAMPEADLLQAMAAADVVIAHAGVGSALAALEVGKKPVLVPRRLSRGEHVDDHQIQIAIELSKRGLAVSVDVDDLSRDDLLAAASSPIATVEAQPLPVDA
jgi:UDP-N-acetylglucosamine transferase subunit ALG13